MARKYSNTAAEAVLSSGVTAAATTMAVDTVAGWPVTFPFTVTLDYDNGAKEVTSVTAVAGLTVQAFRGDRRS